jgi:RimJ/RimL family protein N-acetyltransferase
MSALSAPEIVCERVTLTQLDSDDAQTLFGYRRDPDVSRYQSWVPHDLDDARRFIDGLRSVPFGTPGSWCQLGIRLRDPGTLVGDVGIHFPADEPRQMEVGFTVAPAHQRRGLGAEAVTGLLDHLFGPLRTHRVFASVDPRNEASMRLLRSIGMRQEACFRESLWFKGQWADDVVFAVLAREWRGR